MYLVDTNVISEIRKGNRANTGVQDFFNASIRDKTPLYFSVITLGELRRGIEKLRYRNDVQQANQLKNWLNELLVDYKDNILAFDTIVKQSTQSPLSL